MDRRLPGIIISCEYQNQSARLTCQLDVIFEFRTYITSQFRRAALPLLGHVRICEAIAVHRRKTETDTGEVRRL